MMIKIAAICISSVLFSAPTYTYTEIPLCSTSSVKSYMDGALINEPTSKAYEVMQSLYIDEKGHYTDGENIAVAMSSFYGEVGDCFRITTEEGKTVNVIMADTKASHDIEGMCTQIADGSMVEFIIDTDKASSYYGTGENGYILNGNFNNHPDFKGRIKRIEKKGVRKWKLKLN